MAPNLKAPEPTQTNSLLYNRAAESKTECAGIHHLEFGALFFIAPRIFKKARHNCRKIKA